MTRRLLCAAFLCVVGCHDATSPVPGLGGARARWLRNGPASYELTVTRGCFCPEEAIGAVRVTVQNGVVIARRYVRTGGDVPASLAALFPSVDGLFAAIDDARAQHVASVTADFDPSLGYPTRVDIDRAADATDDEVYYSAALQVR